jgi:hypothetical protein
MQPGEAAIRIAPWVDLNGDSRFAKLRSHGHRGYAPETSPSSVCRPENTCCLRETERGRRASLLLPRQRVVIVRHQVDAPKDRGITCRETPDRGPGRKVHRCLLFPYREPP